MKKILFVAMQMSTHTARWINQLADSGWDVHLFPVNYLPPHPELRGVTVHQPWIVVKPRAFLLKLLGMRQSAQGDQTNAGLKTYRISSIFPIPTILRLLPYLNRLVRVRLGESEMKAPLPFGPHVLSYLIRKLKPDLIHSLEFQHCGYNVLRAKELYGAGFPKWMATNWGSDIYFFRNFEDHRKQISRLLRSIDYYSCECERDVELARGIGLQAPTMSVMPNTGGLDLEWVSKYRSFRRPSDRRIIMIKGYQHFAGRALIALEALERCDIVRDKDYQVVIFSASPEILPKVELLKKTMGIDIRVLPGTAHEEMLRMFGRARVYLGVSVSDAISTSMLEAMAMGAFPIQTNTSCCEEWIKEGQSGFQIPVDDVNVIALRLHQALLDDKLVDDAAEINWQVTQQRLDQNLLREQANSFYRKIFSEA